MGLPIIIFLFAVPCNMEDRRAEMMDEEELLRLLLVEDEEIHDEGRDCYLDEVIGRMRDNLGTASQDPLPGTERIVFGRRTAERIGSTVSAFGRNVLLVTGRSSAATGLRERVLAQLEEAGVGCTVFLSLIHI